MPVLSRCQPILNTAKDCGPMVRLSWSAAASPRRYSGESAPSAWFQVNAAPEGFTASSSLQQGQSKIEKELIHGKKSLTSDGFIAIIISELRFIVKLVAAG